MTPHFERAPGEIWTEYRAAVMYEGGDIRETYATRHSFDEAHADISDLNMHREPFEPKVYAAVVERTRTEPSDWRESTRKGAAAPVDPEGEA